MTGKPKKYGRGQNPNSHPPQEKSHPWKKSKLFPN